MKKIILISQNVKKTENDLILSLSNDWINLFNKFDNVLLIPIYFNSDIISYINNFQVNGIIISGGNNIYQNEEKFNSQSLLGSKIRDSFENNLIKIAEDYDIPLLAICRGCQLLAYNDNYDIKNLKGHVSVNHEIKLINKSRFLNLENSKLYVNSYHNQCIFNNNKEHKNFKIICVSNDNTIEAIESVDEDKKFLGIMWHPERYNSSSSIDNLKLLSSFFNIKIKSTKVIILCAGKGTRLRPYTDNIPKCMVSYKNIQIIDYILESLNLNNLNDITLVKGYLQEKLNKKNTKNLVNKDYNNTNMVYSLFCAIEEMDGYSDIIISYSDIIYNPDIISKLLDSNDKISVVVDKDWYNQWSNRMEDPLSDAETLKINKEGYITEIGKKPSSYEEIEGQYIGLIKFKKDIVKEVVNFYKNLKPDKNIYMTEFLTLISKNLYPLKAVEINGGWSEFDTISDLNYNLDVSWSKNRIIKFGTKAENLINLENKLQNGKILPLYMFTYEDWIKNKINILLNIKNKFNDNIIIRSSSISEDNINISNAGKYLSINKIYSQDLNLIEESINSVFNSYNIINKKDQILIQESMKNVISCGVLFTFDCKTKSYYYNMSYDENGCTDSVTSGIGNSHKSITSLKLNENIKNIYLKSLIPLASELELLFNNDKLDIEFAFVLENHETKLILLQVRPIVDNDNIIGLNSDKLNIYHNKIFNKCNNILNRSSNNLFGDSSILSNMSDWNPAEIIGLKPKYLALSLYKNIITDQIAMLSRKQCGYKDLTKHPLLISLIGRPYIDTRISFSSLIPKDLDDSLSHKLCNYYLNRLKNNPDLHDKIEFEICFTCNTFNLNKKTKVLMEYGFTNENINNFNSELIKLTNNIISPSSNSINKEFNRLNKLEYLTKQIDESNENIINKIFSLLQIIKSYGTLSFSNLARYAFISTSIIISMNDENIISKDTYDKFINSIHTVSKELSNDLILYSNKQITKEIFIGKYGHLRPGSYDITSSSYDEMFEKYFPNNYIKNLQNENYTTNLIKKKEFILNKDEEKLINLKLKEFQFSNEIDSNYLFDFFKKTIEGREEAKFIFTKTLSLILKYIKKFCSQYNLNEDQTSHLDIKLFYEFYDEFKLEPLKDIILNNIENNKNNYKINSKLNLPQIIINNNDIFEYSYINNKPTFITNKKIIAQVININNDGIENMEIKDKIICVENADPGWEWLFSRKIAGLITCYGGMNSHMAIRCYEQSLPAIIGCGPNKFFTYSKSNFLEIDCDMKIVNLIE